MTILSIIDLTANPLRMNLTRKSHTTPRTMIPLDADRAKVDAAVVVEQDMVEAIKEDVVVVMATASDAEEPLGMEDSLPGCRNAYTVKWTELAKMMMMHYF